MINNKCYKSKSAEYSNGTCINIGGYYAAEAVRPYTSYCYYTSFNCRHHTVNGQCYSRASNQSQTVCKTIPQSYFDVSKNTCYYYCTEMPKIRQCFVAHNFSFTRETCRIIGGFYSNRTCYYITSYCPMHKANDGQCYANRSAVLTCNTCSNIGGHYENGFCYYYQNRCSAYNVDGQCYSSQTSTYSTYYCNNMGGMLRNGYCYYEASKCRNGPTCYRNCTCFRYRSSSKTAGTCANIGAYYDFNIRRCFYNSTHRCRYYSMNGQCYRYRSANFSYTDCSYIRGYRRYERNEFGRYSHVCYFNEVNCSIWVNNKCYLRFSSVYNEGTCASIRGYYSRDDEGCYYNSSNCRYKVNSQCYDKRYMRWSRPQCDEARGYYRAYRSYSYCYVSNYYCLRVFPSLRKCYFYTSQSYDCSSCRLLHGFLYSGTCYYKSKNCSQPLFLASNGQCYENQTIVRTATECSSFSGYSFHDNREAKCYFTSTGSCSSGYYVNCQCFIHQSTIYTADSCSNFGQRYLYSNGTCYYNSSYCRYISVNGQCYRSYRIYNSQQICQNIGGYFHSSMGPSSTISYRRSTTSRPFYDIPEPSAEPGPYVPYSTTTARSSFVGKCYYNSFSCSGFIVNDYYCYTNRSATYSRTTCRNIGGMYGYLRNISNYQTSSVMYSYRTYYCLYNAFSCTG